MSVVILDRNGPSLYEISALKNAVDTKVILITSRKYESDPAINDFDEVYFFNLSETSRENICNLHKLVGRIN